MSVSKSPAERGRLQTVRWLLGVSGVAVCALPFTLGCQSLSALRPREKPKEALERPALSAPIPSVADGPISLPGKYDFRIAPYVFLSDFEISPEQPLFKELGRLRDQVSKELLLPPGDAVVQVYLFDTQERYERFMKERHPTLPTRRAFFIAQPRSIGGAEDLLVYTWWSKRIRQDLRHELTHALLHSVIKEVPQWLDEGLAEYFELPPENRGVNAEHADTLRRELAGGRYKCNLDRLERLKDVDDMTPAEYRESWGWVHLMLHSTPEARTVLLNYLQQLRGARRAEMLGPKLAKVFPDMEDEFARHLTRLERDQPRTARARSSDPDLRR